MIAFEPSSEHAALAARVRHFIADEVIPFERDARRTPHGPTDDLRRVLQAKAREAGLFAPQVAREYGGLALSHVGRALVFEEAGYSLLGPLALNLAAPDEGNLHLLEAIASPAHRERWLAPLASGTIRSCFCMTEPPPGAGSDPSMLTTRAVRDGSGYRIHGRKWFITGATGAAFAIIMANLEGAGPTMFVADMASPGLTVERQMESLDSCFPGGHGVVAFDGLFVPGEDVLGAEGEGYRYAQLRLSPARLTHCMRWLGAARRASDIALAHARDREAFGRKLGEHEGAGFMLADNEIDLHVARLAIWHCASVLDAGGLALSESSRTKVIVSEAVARVADRSVQILGGQGVTGETEASRIYADLRAFRIYDGPSEVHRYSLAKRLLRSRTSNAT